MEEVCSMDGKQVFPSSCHAKCMGVEKTKSCSANQDKSGTASDNELRMSLIWIVIICIYISYNLIDFIF